MMVTFQQPLTRMALTIYIIQMVVETLNLIGMKMQMEIETIQNRTLIRMKMGLGMVQTEQVAIGNIQTHGRLEIVIIIGLPTDRLI